MHNKQRARRSRDGTGARPVCGFLVAMALTLLCLTPPAVRVSARADVATPACLFGPKGPELRLNAEGLDDPHLSAYAADDKGNVVLAWTKVTPGGQPPRTDIYAQLFDASGAPKGAEFRVNTDSTVGNMSPAVAIANDGRFAVAWLARLNVAGSSGLYVFAAHGSGQGATGPPVAVNTYTTAGTIRALSVATRAGGGYVVSYVGDYLIPPGTHGHVFARLFNTPGAPAQEFMVDVPSDQKLEAVVVMNDAGDFVVVWREIDDFINTGIFARRYDAAGTPRGPGFRVSTHRGNTQMNASVATDAAGGFVVAWSSWAQDGSGYGVYAQRFDATGVKAGAEFKVNSFTGGDQWEPSVAMGDGGDFVVAWWNRMQDGADVFARRFDPAGAALGEEFLVNATTDGPQYALSVATLDEGGFVAAWANSAPAGSGIYARRFGEDCVTPPGAFVRFSSAAFEVNEGCVPATLTISVERPAGVAPTEVTVDYAVTGGSASHRGDYTYAAGTLLAPLPVAVLAEGRVTFAPFEAEREVTILVNEDGYAEGAETVRLSLLNPAGAALAAPSSATLTINDDDAAEAEANPLDDPRNFVCQHYHDFLHRQPDPAGEAFWTAQLTRCGADAACVAAARVRVSEAFFLSIEFQQTGYFAGRLYEACLGRRPSFEEHVRGVQRLGSGVEVGIGDWKGRLEQNKRAFAEEFVNRADFKVKYPEGMTAVAFVDEMFEYAGVAPTAAERQAAVDVYGVGDTRGRAAAMRAVMESAGVFRHYYNRAFVLSEYFGYLRRDPSDAPDTNWSGYDYWLRKMDEHSLPAEDVTREADAFARVSRGEMVRAFIESLEYRQRFGRH